MARTRKPATSGTSKKDDNELLATLAAANKEYGEGTIRSGTETYQPDRISTDSFMLDFCLLGGIPHNRCTMVIGERSGGKSTFAAKVIKHAQRQYPDQRAVLLDIEGTYDPVWGSHLGIDNKELLIVEPETGEMACDIGEAVVRSRETSLVVVDSLAMLTPMKELESSAEDAHVGLASRMIGTFIRKLNSALISERKRGHYVTVLFINQWRLKIGFNMGDPRTVPGGKAIEFANSVQIDIKNKENKGKVSGDSGVETMDYNDHPFRIFKNKLNNGPRTGEFRLIRTDMPEEGLTTGEIDDANTMLLYAKKFGIYGGGGKSWTLDIYDDSYKFGKAAEAVTALREDPDLKWSLRTQIIQLQAASLGMPKEFIERIGDQ